MWNRTTVDQQTREIIFFIFIYLLESASTAAREKYGPGLCFDLGPRAVEAIETEGESRRIADGQRACLRG